MRSYLVRKKYFHFLKKHSLLFAPNSRSSGIKISPLCCSCVPPPPLPLPWSWGAHPVSIFQLETLTIRSGQEPDHLVSSVLDVSGEDKMEKQSPRIGPLISMGDTSYTHSESPLSDECASTPASSIATGTPVHPGPG